MDRTKNYFAHWQALAYQENHLRRVRETVFRLRFVEAELRDCFERHQPEDNTGGPPGYAMLRVQFRLNNLLLSRRVSGCQVFY